MSRSSHENEFTEQLLETGKEIAPTTQQCEAMLSGILKRAGVPQTLSYTQAKKQLWDSTSRDCGPGIPAEERETR